MPHVAVKQIRAPSGCIRQGRTVECPVPVSVSPARPPCAVLLICRRHVPVAVAGRVLSSRLSASVRVLRHASQCSGRGFHDPENVIPNPEIIHTQEW
jgi:hypothetical protein